MPKLFINGNEANIDHMRYASFHGQSIFSTLRSKNKEALLWSAHWQRLLEHAAYFGYKMPNEQEVLFVIKKTLLECEQEQKIRVIINANNDCALSFEPYEKPLSHIYQGVFIAYSQEKLHPEYKYFKTGNSLPYQRALLEAKLRGVFECLMLDGDAHVVDGSRTSIMHFDGHKLTALMGGLLGIMREEALLYAESLGTTVQRCSMNKGELEAGQLLLANCLLGVVPVGSVRYPVVGRLVDHFRMDI